MFWLMAALGCGFALLVAALTLTYRLMVRVPDEPEVIVVETEDSERHPLASLATSLGAKVAGEVLVYTVVDGEPERVVWLQRNDEVWAEVSGASWKAGGSLSWHSRGSSGHWMSIPTQGSARWVGGLDLLAGHGRAPEWRLSLIRSDLRSALEVHRARTHDVSEAPLTREDWAGIVRQRVRWDSAHRLLTRCWERLDTQALQRLTWRGALRLALYAIPLRLLGERSNLPEADRHWAMTPVAIDPGRP